MYGVLTDTVLYSIIINNAKSDATSLGNLGIGMREGALVPTLVGIMYALYLPYLKLHLGILNSDISTEC